MMLALSPRECQRRRAYGCEPFIRQRRSGAILCLSGLHWGAMSARIQRQSLVDLLPDPEKMLRFKTLSVAALVAAAVSLPACSTISGRPQADRPWGWGHANRAHQALTQKFGVAGFTPGDYVWTDEKVGKGTTEVVVSLSRQTAYVYHG